MALLTALLLPAAFAQGQSTGTVSGIVSLEGIDPIAAPQPVNFEFTGLNDGTNFVLTALIPPSGAYTLTDVPIGSYTLGVKGRKWLRDSRSVSVTANTTTTGVNVYLGACDANNDNVVDTSDFNIFAAVFGSSASIPGSGYDERADFTCDGLVDTTDFNLLVDEFGNPGALYRIALDTLPSAAPRQVHLHWKLKDSDGNLVDTPNGMTFRIYRSASPAYLSAAYFTVVEGSGSGTHIDNNYIDMVPGPGEYYYQIVTGLMNNLNPPDPMPLTGLSNQAQYVPASNPLIEPDYPVSGVYTITGFQPDLSTINYQANVTNGLLNSYKVYDSSGQNGREFFRNNGTTNSYPFQYGSDLAFNNYILGCYNLFTPPLTIPIDSITGTYHHLMSAKVTGASQITAKLSETYQVKTINPESTIIYDASTTGLFVTLDASALGNPDFPIVDTAWLIGCGVDSDYNNSDHVVAVQSKDEALKNYLVRLHGDGITHKLPLVTGPYRPDTEGLNGIADMRYFLDNGAALDVQNVNSYGTIAGTNINYFGSRFSTSLSAPYYLPSTAWGRGHFKYLDAIQFAFNAVSNPKPAYSVNSGIAPPFRIAVVPDSEDPLKQYYPAAASAGQGMIASTTDGIHSNTLPLRILFDQRSRPQQSNWPGALFFNYEVTDFWHKTVYTTANNPNARIEVDTNSLLQYQTPYSAYYGTGANYYYKDCSLDLSFGMGTAQTGWFQIRVWLDQGDANNPKLYVPDEDIAQYGVYTYQTAPPNPGSGQQPSKPYLYNTPAATIGQALGMRSMRVDADVLRDKYGHITDAKLYPNKLNGGDDSRFLPQYSLYDGIGNPFNFPAATTPDTNATSQFGLSLEKGTTDDAFQKDVYSVVASYANQSNTTYTYNGNTYRGDPFAAWSISNEPLDGANEDRKGYGGYVTTDDILQFILHKMQPGYQGVHAALTHSPAMVLGPNGPGGSLSAYSAYPQLQSSDPLVYKPNRLSWMEDFFHLGGAEYTDGIGIHTYTGNERSWEEHGVAESIQYLEWLRDNTQAGDGNYYSLGQPLWITEHGWGWQWSNDMPRLQAAYIVRRYALAASMGIPHEHDFYFKPAENDFTDANYYLWSKTPTRGGMAMRVLGEMTQGLCAYDGYSNTQGSYTNNSHDLFRNLPNAASLHVHAIAYTDPDTTNTAAPKPPVIVVWGDDFTDSKLDSSDPVSLTFTVPNASVHVYDIMGNDMNIQHGPINGPYTYQIPAGSSPVYVKMNASDYMNNNIQALQISGWPLLSGETNYALRGAASTYAYDSRNHLHTEQAQGSNAGGGLYDGGAAALNDGSWHFDDLTTIAARGYDEHLQRTLNYVPWVSNTAAGAAPASSSSPIYPVYAQVTLTTGAILPSPPGGSSPPIQSVPIDTVVAVGPSANGHLSGVRDYDIQVQELLADGTKKWDTVKSVRGNTTEWVLMAHFDPINAIAVRIVIYDVNNGNWYEDKTPLPLGYDANGNSVFTLNSANRAMLYELEAWGS